MVMLLCELIRMPMVVLMFMLQDIDALMVDGRGAGGTPGRLVAQRLPQTRVICLMAVPGQASGGVGVAGPPGHGVGRWEGDESRGRVGVRAAAAALPRGTAMWGTGSQACCGARWALLALRHHLWFPVDSRVRRHIRCWDLKAASVHMHPLRPALAMMINQVLH